MHWFFFGTINCLLSQISQIRTTQLAVCDKFMGSHYFYNQYNTVASLNHSRFIVIL